MHSYSRKLLSSSLLIGLLGFGAASADGFDQQEVLSLLGQIEERNQDLQEQIAQLKALVGAPRELEGLDLLEATEGLSLRVRIRLEDGSQAFAKENWEEAKEAFQKAWEITPQSHVTSFNLAMAYLKLGNTPLAKKMFSSAIETNSHFEGAEQVKKYLGGKKALVGEAFATEEDKAAKNDMHNLRKQADSFVRADNMSFSERYKETLEVLQQMRKMANKHSFLKKEFYVGMAEMYSLFECYDQALEILDDYLASMKGEVLPDNFYGRRLELEAQKKNLDDTLGAYLGNEPSKDIRRRLERGMEELSVFASQLDQFAEKLGSEDADFNKICKRLKEYRWGSRPNRHVLVVDRFENLLFSSLDGTVSLGRYQDSKGNKFFRHITQLAGKMPLKKTEFREVEIAVRGEKVPYILMYTYIPKHEAFIIVRLPRGDLA